jgi:hypothetical protein
VTPSSGLCTAKTRPTTESSRRVPRDGRGDGRAVRNARSSHDQKHGAACGNPSKCALAATIAASGKQRRTDLESGQITIRILLSVKILIEFRPQCLGSIHYSVCGEKGLPCRLGGREA